MLRLEQYRGHFYNWYDTRTLQPVEPRDVSSVDSGNLWGLVLREGLDELHDRPLVPARFLEAIQDTLEVIVRLRSAAVPRESCDQFDATMAKLRRLCAGTFWGGARGASKLLGAHLFISRRPGGSGAGGSAGLAGVGRGPKAASRVNSP